MEQFYKNLLKPGSNLSSIRKKQQMINMKN